MSIAAWIVVPPYLLCSLVLLVFGIQCYVLTWLFLRSAPGKIPLQRERMRFFDTEDDPARYPDVVIQLPMYNEKQVAQRSIEAAGSMDWPSDRFAVQVLDDSTDATAGYIDAAVARLVQQGVQASVVRRGDRTGFKAGALQNGLRFTNAEFVAIFDADFVPGRDFLRKSIPFFVDRPDIGLVQGRWTHLNRKASIVTRAQAMGIDGHFVIEQAARSWSGLFMNFNGTAGVFRRSAIETSGGWQHDTLTEDMDLSYRMQLAGWKTEFVPELEVPAELPEDINGFKNQQFRWAKGSIQTAIKILPQLSRSNATPFQMLQAFLHLTHYAVHPFMLALALMTPVLLTVVKVSLSPWVFAIIVAGMLLSTSGPSAMYMVAQRFLGVPLRRRIPLIPAMMLVGIGLAINNTRAVVEALTGRESPFHRTPKKGENRRLSNYRPIRDISCILELAAGMYCLAGFQTFFNHSSVIITPFLVMYAAGFLFVGALSIIHYRRPELIDRKVALPQFART